MDTNTTTEQATPATPEPSKAEKLAADRTAKRAAKAFAKMMRKARNAEKRANGVIGTLHQALANPHGTTKREILQTLTDKFPDRDPIGMATTVGIQLSRLQKKYGKIVSRKQSNRGLVYGYERTVQFAPEGSNGTHAPVPLPEPIEEPTTPRETVVSTEEHITTLNLMEALQQLGEEFTPPEQVATVQDLPVEEPEPKVKKGKKGKK
jgi:hypothetical protein